MPSLGRSYLRLKPLIAGMAKKTDMNSKFQVVFSTLIIFKNVCLGK